MWKEKHKVKSEGCCWGWEDEHGLDEKNRIILLLELKANQCYPSNTKLDAFSCEDYVVKVFLRGLCRKEA